MSQPRFREMTEPMIGHTYTLQWNSEGKLIMDRDLVNPDDTVGSWSRIYDVKGNRQGVNPCSHYKSVIEIPAWGYGATTTNWGRTDPDPKSVNVKRSDNWTAGSMRMRYGHVPGFHSFGVDWDQAMTQLYKSAVGVLPQGASLAVNLAELKSLKTLAPSILKGLGAFTKRLSRKSFKDLAGSHLAVEFGLKPTLKDMAAFISGWDTVKKKWKHLYERSHKWTRISAKAPTSYNYTPKEIRIITGTYGTGPSNEGLIGYKSEVLKNEAYVSCDCYSELNMADEAALIRLFIGYLGLNNPVQIGWELIPFSFVIDWFYPVGKRIASAKLPDSIVSVMDNVKMKNFVWTTDREYKETFCECRGDFLFNSGYCAEYAGPRNDASTITRSEYNRQITVPEGGSAPSGWTIRRGALSASLITQRVLK